MNDVLLNKAATVERCVARVRETLIGDPALATLDAQDVAALNLQRAALACIDGATHAVRAERLEVPQTSRDAFGVLADTGALDLGLAAAMMRVVDFRDAAVHKVSALNLDVGRAVAADGLGNVEAFARWMVARA